MKTKGITLIELLLSAVILVAVTVGILLAFRTTFREFKFTCCLSRTLQENTADLDVLAKEIMVAEGIYCSNTDVKDALLGENGYSLISSTPLPNTSNFITFNIGDRVRGYYLDSVNKQIKGIIFDSLATSDPSSWNVNNPDDINIMAQVLNKENYQYDKFTIKVIEKTVDSKTYRILEINMDLSRTKREGAEGRYSYPFTTKVYLEREPVITP